MARQPVTRMQLDAYRFGQRRLESALARRDPVLLHEEIRGQRRVVVVSVALAMLALAGTFGYAKVVPKPAWNQQDVVVGKQSGRLFAVIHQPDRLVPVANLAAARLVLNVAASKGSGGRGGSSGAATPVAMDDAGLDRAPRTATAAVPGAAAVLPADTGGDPAPPTGPWAVCDTADPGARPATMVVAGAAPPKPMPATAGLLLAAPDGQLHLVAGNRRYRIAESVVLRAYDLVGHPAREVSAAVLNAIPEGRALAAPEVRGDGSPAPGGLPGQVGDVVRVSKAGAEDRYFLVLAGGVQEVSEPVANLVRTGSRFDPSEPAPTVRLEQVNAMPRASVPGLADYPTVAPRVPEGPDARSVCWQWNPDGRGGAVTVDKAPPLPAERAVTPLAQADGPGSLLDAVSVPAGTATVVRAVPGRDPAPGALWLVSETGVGYQVASGQDVRDNPTAAALGIRPDSAGRAPEQALRLLPAGPLLDVAQAEKTVDVLLTPPSGG